MPDIVSLGFENAGISTLQAGVASFGQVFLPGEVPQGSSLTADFGGVSHAVQLDVKTRYADGSVKMAVLSVERPAIAAGTTLDVKLATGAPTSAAAIELNQALSGHSFVVDLDIHGGSHVSVDVLDALQKAMAAGTASFWQQGELATQARVEVDLAGSQRLVFDVTAYKGGGFSVDAQFNNDGAMGASGGRVDYDLTVHMDGREAARETVSQAQYQNWHESFSSNAADGGQGTGDPSAGWLNIRHDVSHLQEAGVVAGYDLGLSVNPSLLAEYAAATQAAGWGDPLAMNGVSPYMPGTGGRADIGFTTLANTSWLISQDAHAAAYAMGQAEASGSVPWNFWDAANKTWLSTDDYPQLWTDGRGGTGTPGDANSGGLTQQVPDDTGWTVDVAHQPNLSFVPYVLTGERWMLDNLSAQAASNILGQYPPTRGGADDNVINENQVRGAAWALREIDEAAWTAPDGSPEQAYFQKASADNYAWLVSKIPEWTAQQGEAHGWVPGNYGAAGAMPPWQQDYFASTVIAAASRGNADALTFLNWQANFLVGRFTHAAEGFDQHDGAAYLIAISDTADGSAPYTTWAQIGEQTEARGWSNGDGWSQTQGDYAQLALATLAGIYRLTGSAEAKAAYDALMHDAPPFTGTSDYQRDPTYAIAGPDGSAPKPGVSPDHVGQVPVVTPPEPGNGSGEHPGTDPGTIPGTDPGTHPGTDPGTHPGTDPGTTPGKPEAGHPGDHVSLAVVLGAESWNGDPLAVIRVDGEEVFRGTVSAQHTAGGEKIDLGDYAADAAHKITVEFLNDAWGGSADTDRNLHVQAVLVNGVDTGQHQALLENGEADFAISPTSPGTTPPGQTEGGTAPSTGPDVLRLALSQDEWRGDAQYAVLVDGQEVSRGAVTASHAAGEQQFLELTGNFSDGEHAVTVRFLNDAWGGTADTDRNLYLDSASLNGVDLHFAASLFNEGDAAFSFSGAKAAAPVALAAADVSRILVSEDGHGVTAATPGEGAGQEVAATASQAQTEAEAIELQHSIDQGHDPAAASLQDGVGTAPADHNLYVEVVSSNEMEHHVQTPVPHQGDAIFSF
ncbi:carbohydrate-binding domain-containing protein [Roseococcus pinisoli]|uniref:Carbohydrate binding module xylan-binding domain-containing protein n=1 Tax=Roseococcus pinisoli TaxID=2835040 RepID=A0ABS5QEM6_9PROT|nr:carbohydrate-binding domain-containing protein [Roseococcus pinisoli]MBS7812019.1 hypothetical protein [Roseococcus pinisoli]